MAYHKASEDIQLAWDILTSKWSAEVKSKYFDQILEPLYITAEGIYQRNELLEEYAENCVNSL